VKPLFFFLGQSRSIIPSVFKEFTQVVIKCLIPLVQNSEQSDGSGLKAVTFPKETGGQPTPGNHLENRPKMTVLVSIS
jgi:hypothetical protein